MNTISFDKILVTYIFQPDLEDLVQHLRLSIVNKEHP